MLELLRIRHLALIDDMELEFSGKMNVLTGETGAGKSFILKALNFLTGEKMRADLVRAGEDKAQVEALFVIDGEEYIIRRELVAATGRSRLYINDKLSSQEAIRNLKPKLLVHTSQHGQQQLLQPAFQEKLLNDFLQRPDLLEERNNVLKTLRDIAAQQDDLRERARILEDKRDFLEFQQKEIAKVAPEAGEEEELEAKKQETREQGLVEEAVEHSLGLLYTDNGALAEVISRLENSLDAVCRYLPEYQPDVERILEFRHSLGELETRLRNQPMHRPDEESIEEIEARLYELAQLKRKLNRSLDEIVNMQQEIEENLTFLDTCNLDLKLLDKQENEARETLQTILEQINQLRESKGKELCDAIETELKTLGFSEHVHVEFQFTPTEIYPECFEGKARLIWVPNPGQSPQPLDKIASGGELSRFLLAVVGLMNKNETPTLIFDEVDAGIGGITLNYVADALTMLAERQQMLLITHWPQLAARAEKHFLVRKEVRSSATFTSCDALSENGIREEYERMAGGGQQGEALARELLGTG
ncbi:DNA repair protein RecN [Halodesulfovibrio spirochaetisodalis]|uniref:DNA repair protein RecN n=1 Tax=Halodesulfovibrio spirochaetisodalis TaxID=1560234 RepID=A0A1B7XKZ9_9BACT|nr:AAA family ATPase [Halodesulfovibrio spirochaetisodalis]OBQ56182.1 DNA recombination protein RecN [Halodesulfovibrio spirochaetisodalis]